MTRSGRSSSPTTRLIRYGFREVARAEAILAEEWFARACPDVDGHDGDALLSQIGSVADPDLALLALSRIEEAASPQAQAALEAVLREAGGPRSRLLAVVGNSTALADQLVAHPDDAAVITDESAALVLDEPAETTREALLRAVGADPSAAVARAKLPPAAQAVPSTRCAAPTAANCSAWPPRT